MSAPRIDHIGIIVPDLEAAIERFSALLGGLAPERRDLPDVGLRIAEFHAANIAIELIAYDGEAQLARRVMGSAPGFNHVTVAVDDVDRGHRATRGSRLSPAAGVSPRRRPWHGCVLRTRPGNRRAVRGLCAGGS